MVFAAMIALQLSVAVADAASGSPFGRSRVVSAGIVAGGWSPSVAVNRRGETVVAWPRACCAWRAHAADLAQLSTAIVVRRAGTDGHFGPIEVVQRGDASISRVVIGPDGTVAAMWHRCGRDVCNLLQVRVARRGHALGPVQTLSRDPTASGVRLLAVSGRLVAVWEELNEGPRSVTVRYAVAGTSGRFGKVRVLAAAARDLSGAIATAVGDVTIAYGTADGRGAIATLARAANGFAPPTLLTGDCLSGSRLANGAGGTIAICSSWEGRTETLEVARRTTTGLFGPARAVALPDLGARDIQVERVVAVPRGGVVLAWTFMDLGDAMGGFASSALDIAVEKSDGTFGAPVRLAEPAARAQRLAAGATRDTAVLSWVDGRAQRLRYVVRRAGQAVTTPRTLAEDVTDGPAIAAAGDRAVLAWVSSGSVRFTAMGR